MRLTMRVCGPWLGAVKMSIHTVHVNWEPPKVGKVRGCAGQMISGCGLNWLWLTSQDDGMYGKVTTVFIFCQNGSGNLNAWLAHMTSLFFLHNGQLWLVMCVSIFFSLLGIISVLYAGLMDFSCQVSVIPGVRVTLGLHISMLISHPMWLS